MVCIVQYIVSAEKSVRTCERFEGGVGFRWQRAYMICVVQYTTGVGKSVRTCERLGWAAVVAGRKWARLDLKRVRV